MSNPKFLNIEKKVPYNVYLLFNTIFRQNKKNLVYAYNLFDEMCIPINKYFFDEYLYDKLVNDEYYTKYRFVHMYHDYLNNEESKMVIMNTFIKIKSNKLDNIFINCLLEVDNFFMCDFNSNFYKLCMDKKFVKVK